MDDGSITLLVALIVLIAFSAFFSASETAFSSLNQIRLKSRAEEGDTSAARVLAMAEKYDKLLSSILIGNNIVNIAAASIGTVLFTKWLGAERGATTSTIVLTVVVLIFGEVTPKTLAKEMPETIATAVSPVLSLLLTLFTPLTWLFSQWKKLLGRFVHSSESDAITEGELITMVSEAENDGELTDRIYWGYPTFFNTTDAALSDPTLILGEKLLDTSLGLRKVPVDTVYYPVHDLVFGTQEINIGQDDLQAHLIRATAALGVITTETNGNAFSESIDSMWIYISNIYSNLNYFSAQPEGTVKTIRFGLIPNADRKEFSNKFVSVFPSQPNPMIQVFVQMKNGDLKHYQQKLTTQLSAGTKTTVNLSMDGVLLEEGGTGGFQVDQWKEQNDSIHIPLN